MSKANETEKCTASLNLLGEVHVCSLMQGHDGRHISRIEGDPEISVRWPTGKEPEPLSAAENAWKERVEAFLGDINLTTPRDNFYLGHTAGSRGEFVRGLEAAGVAVQDSAFGSLYEPGLRVAKSRIKKLIDELKEVEK